MSGFPCSICKIDKCESERMKLKCGHMFCWQCMNTYLKKNLQPKIKCPVAFCYDMIRDGQIRRVLCEDDIETYEKLCTASLSKTHKCLLKQCSSKLMYTDSNVQYECPTCTLYNCIKCNAAHMFTNCATYQSKTEAEKALICQNEIQRAEQIFDAKMGEKNRLNLLEWDAKDILQNYEVFTCSICMLDIGKGKGVKLQNCDHNICKDCLTQAIEVSKIPVCCSECGTPINEREIQSVLSQKQLQIYEDKCKQAAKRNIEMSFQCQTPDCRYFYEITNDQLEKFTCLQCKAVNCVKCLTIHNNETCEEYLSKIDKKKAEEGIEELIKQRKLMRCPKCKNLLSKKSGCNWVQCKYCDSELCWIKQMFRWGPKGRGDITGGCKCGVNNVPCDPECVSTCTPHQENPENINIPFDPLLFHFIMLHELFRSNLR